MTNWRIKAFTVWLCLCWLPAVFPLASVPSKKYSLPASELTDRRKSPALWRLLYDEEEPSSDTNHVQQSQQNPTPKRSLPLRKPEIMAPAGGWAQLKAAVANGADAVYLGLQAFSARARAENFHVTEDLPNAVAYCHQYNIHVYVALNTLVFDELEELSQLVQLCHRAKVDALIVQDLGLCKLVQSLLGDKLPIHSSTQQSITSADGVDFCQAQHGAARVVLGRELSVSEIQHVTDRTNVEIETFVHGALCVSYSGQCFSSEQWGGRSANRGQCAQACRLPYGLIVDGELTETEDMKYVLSPQDLCGLDQVAGLVKAGVSCLKIEGRLKDATYVAATTRAYRNAVDQAWEQLMREEEMMGDYDNANNQRKVLSSNEDVSRLELTQLFSRGQDETFAGLTPGFLAGTRHQEVVRGRSPRHRGVHIGRVANGSSPASGIVIEQDADSPSQLKRGDGIVIDRGLAQEEELGSPVFDIQPLGYDKSRQKNRFLIQLSRDAMQKWKRYDKQHEKDIGPLVPTNAHVWKTHDAVVEKKFRRLSQLEPPSQSLQIAVRGSLGQPLQILLTYGSLEAIGQTEMKLQEAQTNGLSLESIRKAIGKLGNTEYSVNGDDIDFSQLSNRESLWCPASQIKAARRRAVEELQSLTSSEETMTSDNIETELIVGEPERLLNELNSKASDIDTTEDDTNDEVQLSVLCRNFEQVDAICSMIEAEQDTNDGPSTFDRLSEIMVDFLEVDGMRDAVDRIRAYSDKISVTVASPRVLKPEEGGIWKTLLSLEPDALLVRSTGLLYRMKQMGGEGALVEIETAILDVDEASHITAKKQVRIPKLIGDFSLNAANPLTAHELLGFGLERVTASYDLNANGIAKMASLLGPTFSRRLEVVAHCKMPIFHTEHCVFARFLTKGDSYLDCGHACTRHAVHLRDEISGMDNLVLADMGCRNTVFAAQAQSGIHSLIQWHKAGIRHFRIELVDELPYDARKVVRTYLSTLNGDCKPSVGWEILSDCKDSNGRIAGVTLGSFKNGKQRRAGELATQG